MTTRLGTERDVGAVIQLVRRCIDDMTARGIDQWDEFYPSADTVLADAHARTLHVASLDTASLVGVFTLDTTEDPRWAVAEWSITDVPVGVVHRLMVDPQHQGRGIARALMEIAESHARDLGLGVIRLIAFLKIRRLCGCTQGSATVMPEAHGFAKGSFAVWRSSSEPSLFLKALAAARSGGDRVATCSRHIGYERPPLPRATCYRSTSYAIT